MANISDAIVYDKVREVYTFMINASKQRKEVVQYFSKKWTDEGYFTTTSEASKHRTIDNYIRKVRNSYFNFESDVEIEKGRTLARYEDLYSKMIKIQDYKGAAMVLKELSNITGINAPIKTDVTTKGEKINLTDEQVDKILQNLKNKSE